MPKLLVPGDCVLVVRGLPRSIVMVCPDGCGENITINLDRRTGKAWRKFETSGKLTIYPSVWRDTGCRAHFIVLRDRIIWCDSHESSGISVDESIIEKVFKQLSNNNYVHFEQISDLLQAIPWEVLWACKELVRRGQAQVSNKDNFKRIGTTFIPNNGNGRISIRA